jgi:LPS export ABC transporter protein LptC
MLLLLAASCRNKMEDIQALVGKSVMQEDRAYDVTILYSEDGQVKARLFSREFIRNETSNPPFTDMQRGLKVEFFNDTLEVESTLTAKYARYYEQQGNVLIRDSVVVVNKKGDRLETEELIWNQNVQKFYTEKPVAITTATQTMWGDGLEANQDFSWYQIKSLRGTMLVEKDQVPE